MFALSGCVPREIAIKISLSTHWLTVSFWLDIFIFRWSNRRQAINNHHADCTVSTISHGSLHNINYHVIAIKQTVLRQAEVSFFVSIRFVFWQLSRSVMFCNDSNSNNRSNSSSSCRTAVQIGCRSRYLSKIECEDYLRSNFFFLFLKYLV